MSVEKYHAAVGPCPVCGKRAWLNNIPLTAYCFGTKENPHEEVHCIVPSPEQPYGYIRGKQHWKYENNQRVASK